MNVLKLLKKYIIDSQIFVALMGTFFALFFMYENNVIKLPTIALIFITYFSGYLYTKYQNSNKYFRKILLFNTFCGLVAVLLIILNHNQTRLFKWCIIVFLGLLYNSSFLTTAIRKIPLLKIFYVGITWALINSWLILPNFDAGIFWVSFFFISALVLPFDIRDMNEDTVITFPMLIGVRGTKTLAIALIFTSMVIAFFTLPTLFIISFILAGIVAILLTAFAENSRRDSYFSFWVESCSALPLLFFLLIQLLLN